MSRRRRAPEESDSLELLLDPICNMFGTIVFVALIAALITMARSERAVAEATDAALRGAPHESAGVERLRAREAELESMLATLPAPTDEGPVLEAGEERVARAAAEIVRRERIVERYRETLADAVRDFDSLADEVEPLREEVDRLEEALVAALRAKNRVVRTPIEREVDRFEYTIVLWQDRLYAICDLTTRPSDPCEALRQWNQRHVVVGRCATPVFECSRVAIRIERHVELRAGRGIPVGEVAALRADPEFRALLATLDPARDLVGFVVAPDSFDAFATVKELFLGAGFNYFVEPSTQPFPTYDDAWIPGMPRGL